MSVTYCVDPRCTSVGKCWRAENEDFGNAPGENYGPRCAPAPPAVTRTAEDERADVLSWLRDVGASASMSADEMVTLHWVARAIFGKEHVDAAKRGKS